MLKPNVVRTALARKAGLEWRQDDFYEVWNEYFLRIIEERKWRSLPAGVQDTKPPNYCQPSLAEFDTSDLKEYNVDVRDRLVDFKIDCMPFVDVLFNESCEHEAITFFPSTTQALLAILLVHREMGVRHVVFETPCYFGPIYQSEFLNLDITILLTHEDEDFQAGAGIDDVLSEYKEPLVLMLTEPKFATGARRSPRRLQELLAVCSSDITVVVDEAVVQSFGTNDDYVAALKTARGPLFRIRSLTKGLGLNGVKVAVVKHDCSFRKKLSATHDLVSGAIDRFSFSYFARIAKEPETYSRMMAAAQDTVRQNYRAIDRVIDPSLIKLLPIEDGYFGVGQIDLDCKARFEEHRRLLLSAAKLEGVPILTGPSLFIPGDNRHEWFRLNYFQSQNQLIEAGLAVNDVVHRYHSLRHAGFA